MSKVVDTYWDKWSPGQPRARRSRRDVAKRPAKAAPVFERPKLVGPTILAALTVMLCLTINFRSFSELSREVSQNEVLNGQIQTVTNQNIALQQEIYELKNDKKTIEREARKIGLTKSVK